MHCLKDIRMKILNSEVTIRLRRFMQGQKANKQSDWQKKLNPPLL